tara:strand:- start:41031 stop:42347 length:1317 start_codon:yes stop_codon:yes gene_type:complete
MENEIEVKALTTKIDSLLAKIKEKSEKEEINSVEIKSLKEDLIKTITENKISSNAAVLEQKSQLDAIEAKLNNPFNPVNEEKKLNETHLKEDIISICKAIDSRKQVRLEETKAIRITDATTTGGFIPSSVSRGLVDVNAQPELVLLSEIDNLPAVNTLKEESFFIGYDSSFLDLDGANEMDAADVSRLIELSIIKIVSRKEQAKILVSSDIMLSAAAGDVSAMEIVQRNLSELRIKFYLRVVKKVFADMINNANSSEVKKIVKIPTTTNNPTQTATLRENLRNFPSNLKKVYIGNSVMYLSRTYLDSIFAKESSDGHLPLEQFRYEGKITYFLTPGKAYRVETFEHDQIGTYKSLVDGTTDITTDYDPAALVGANAGKLLAIVGDFKKGYKHQPSTAGTIGYDSSISNLLDGAIPAGIISYVAQGLGVKEALKLLYSI